MCLERGGDRTGFVDFDSAFWEIVEVLLSQFSREIRVEHLSTLGVRRCEGCQIVIDRTEQL